MDSSGTVVTLTQKEGAVTRNAVSYYLSEDDEVETEVEDALSSHKGKLHGDGAGRITIQPGMTDLYQTIFQTYAQGLKNQLDTESTSDELELMGEFFEQIFKSVVGKIEDAETGGL